MTTPASPTPERRPGWAGLLLAGGRARRMGIDKLQLRLRDGGRLIERPASVLRATCEQCVAVGARQPLELDGFLELEDAASDGGPLAGVLAGLLWARRAGLSWALVLAGDLPEVDAALFAHLQEEAERDPARALWCRSRRGAEPLAGAWPTALVEPLQATFDAGQRAVHRALTLDQRRLWVYADLDRMSSSLRNLNEPQDWEAYSGQPVERIGAPSARTSRA